MNIDLVLEQTQWDPFWVPPRTVVHDRPEVLYTVHPDDIPSLNVANRIRAQGAVLDGVLSEISDAHVGRQSRVPVNPQNTSDALLRGLERRGYRPGHAHDGFVISTSTTRRPDRSGLLVRRVSTLPTLRDAIFVANEAFGRGEDYTEEALAGFLASCAPPTGRVHRFVVYDAEGVPLTSGGMTFFPALRFVFLWGGGTVPDGRGQGAYSALVSARLRCAARLGATHAGLYARLGTSAPIVAAQGFTRHGRMTFWERVPDAAAPGSLLASE